MLEIHFGRDGRFAHQSDFVGSLLELLYPLLHLFSHCLVRAHERLLVDDDFSRVGFRTTDSGSDRRRVRFNDDAVNGNETASCTR